MHEKHLAGVFLEIFVVMVVLALLVTLAIPQVGQLLDKSRGVSPDTEYNNIPTVVPEIPSDSEAGTPEPVQPTGNMSEVPATDSPP
jgi:hypothetical protein